jgi:16S rRNA (guanine966-N2)-methyltransferase
VTRIVAGVARGRRLDVPDGRGTRPTSDRAREGLFSALISMLGSLDGRRVLDLYAGSGAVGLEALSRGAAHVLLVESDRAAAGVIAANIDRLALPGAVVRTGSVGPLLGGPPPGEPYDVVFLDPPYETPDADVDGVLAALVDQSWLVADAVVVVERPTRGGEPAWPPGVLADRSRRYGEGTLWYGRASGA